MNHVAPPDFERVALPELSKESTKVSASQSWYFRGDHPRSRTSIRYTSPPAIPYKAIIETRAMLKQLTERDRRSEGRGNLEGFQVSIHVRIQINCPLLDETHNRNGGEGL